MLPALTLSGAAARKIGARPIVLTFFSIPKPFKGHVNIIQRNAIQSWIQLKPACQIILFGDDEGTAEAAREFGLHHIPDIVRNEYNTPVLNDIFEKAEKFATTSRLCYINADIILLGGVLEAIQNVRLKRFLMVGQRWDMDIDSPLDFSRNDWGGNLRNRLLNNASLHSIDGIDYFIFSSGIWGHIPPFAVGRTAWDNWLIYSACARRAAVIDASRVITALHQNHDYSHAPNGWKMVWEGPESIRNKELAGGKGKLFTLLDAKWILTPDGLVHPQTPSHLQRQQVTWPVLHPVLYAFKANILKIIALPRRLAGFILRCARRFHSIN
jgi:hypothetical protein